MEAYNPSVTFPFPYTLTNITTTFTPTPTPTAPSPPPIWPMDSQIWSKLPTRILDRVLAFLPPPAFFRARSVCKRWYSLLYSSSFLQLYLKVQLNSPPKNWFIFFHHNTSKPTSIIPKTNGGPSPSPAYQCAYLFDPYDLTWYTIPFPLIPAGYSPAASSGGLICWVSDEPGPKNIFLHNPLVGCMAQLPPTLRPRLFPSVGLSITTSSVDVALAGDDLISPYAVKNLTTESFHVDGGGYYSIWGTTSFLPRLCSLESGHMVESEGRFYCMNYSPFSVVAHDISSNAWWKIQAPMRRFLRSPSLVESQGKVVLVAAVEKSKLNVPRSLRLWGLQEAGQSQWVEIERMPQQLYAQFEEVEQGRGFDCVGHGEFIVIMIRASGANDNNKGGLLFDIVRKRWVWMPCCPAFGGELHGFGFEPRLATPVTALVEQLTQLRFS